MIRTEDISSVNDGNVHGSGGEKIGSVGQLYLDNHSGQPAWVTVKTGLFGTKASFVPLAEATVDGRDLRVPYDKETVKNAPNVDADGELTAAEEDELYRYYKLDSGHHGDEARDATGVAAGNRDSEHGQEQEQEHGEHHKDDDVRSDRHGEDQSGEREQAGGEREQASGEREQAGGERRIRRYMVTEETVTRREEIPTDEPRP